MKLEACIKVQVFDFNGKRIQDAKVELIDREKKSISIPFNDRTGFYEAKKITPGSYILKTSRKEYATESREMRINHGENEALFILGRKDMPFFYRGDVKVPFEPLPNYLGIVLKDIDNVDNLQKYKDRLNEIAKKHNLKPVKTGENIQKNGLFVYEFKSDVSEKGRQEIQESIKRNEFVFLCSPILKLFEQNATLLTDSIIVRFKGHVSKDEVSVIAKKYSLSPLRNIPYVGNAYQFVVKGPISYGILDICESLVRTGKVEYAEPDLWHTTEDDQINPTDWLFPEQWDHPIINTPDAWQVLSDININRTFGDPDVILAVVDSGVDAAHPAFSGNLTNSNPKIYQLFDFANMVANNNNFPVDTVDGGPVDHGTGCAGAATGRANDPSAVLGVNEGTAGIAGNCRLIGIRRSGPESRYADMYIWISGFNPNSAIVGFPAVINPGADVITNSFGYSTGIPISGLMRDTFDFLTTYGRGGKGVLLFFSAGNQGGGGCNGADGTLLRPWGMYRKCHSITASTLDNAGAEVKSSYSNFGPNVSFCAPSNSNCTGIHNPPNDYGAFTSTIQNRINRNTPGRPTIQTTLSVNAAAGNNIITVNNVAGLVAGQAILVGNPGNAGTEAKIINAISALTTQVTLSQNLFNNHPNGTNVFASTRDYRNNFGGTSYATPVCAGLSALMLSANRGLTWIEVRELIRNTAVKIDQNNADPVGRWRDVNGLISTDIGYAGPFFSQWYGYGRINAAAAVQDAGNYTFQRDILIRDNLADNGLVPSAGTFWEGVDIWVRNADDNIVPANYMTHANTVHIDPIFGQNNWVYVRFKNIGALSSFNFFVRVYLTHWAGTEFIYPDNFIPTVRPSDPIPSPLTPGTYLIGETMVNSLAAAADGYVSVQWNANLIPPQTVNVGGTDVTWHPCLLVEISPHDGFTPPGNHVWENNNLAQKNISITYPDDAGDFAFAGVAGNLKNRSRFLSFEIKIKWPIPRSINAYVRFFNRYVEKYLETEIKDKKQKDLKVGKVKDKTVFLLSNKKSIKFKLPNIGLLPFIIGGKVGKLSKKDIVVIEVQQYDDNGRPSGGLTVEVKGKAE